MMKEKRKKKIKKSRAKKRIQAEIKKTKYYIFSKNVSVPTGHRGSKFSV